MGVSNQEFLKPVTFPDAAIIHVSFVQRFLVNYSFCLLTVLSISNCSNARGLAKLVSLSGSTRALCSFLQPDGRTRLDRLKILLGYI